VDVTPFADGILIGGDSAVYSHHHARVARRLEYRLHRQERCMPRSRGVEQREEGAELVLDDELRRRGFCSTFGEPRHRSSFRPA